MSKALAVKTVWKCRENQQEITKEWKILEVKIDNLIEQKGLENSGEGLSKIIKAHVQYDIRSNELFQKQVVNCREKVPFAVEYSKTHILLNKTLELLNTYGDNIKNLINDYGTAGLNALTSSLPHANNKSGWGTADAVFYSATLLEIYFALSDTNINDYNNSTSAISHIYPLPKSVDVPVNYSLGYNKADTNAICLIGSYQFGGSRLIEELPPILPKKLINAHDCSGMIEEFNNHENIIMTTKQQFYLYQLSHHSNAIIDEYTPPLTKIYDVADQCDLGSLRVTRIFKGDYNPNNSSGIGGHVMLDLGNGLSINYNRDIENQNMEGFFIVPCNSSEALKNNDSIYTQITGEKRLTLEFYLNSKADHYVTLPKGLENYVTSVEIFQDYIDPETIVQLYDQSLLGQNSCSNEVVEL